MPATTWSKFGRVGMLALALALAASACKKNDASAADGGSMSSESGGNSLAFLKGFEGEIDGFVKDDKPGESQVPITVFIKGSKVRFDIPEKLGQSAGAGAGMLGPKAYALFDGDAKKLSLVSDSQKQVLVIDLNKSGEQLKGLGKPPEHGSGPNAPQMKLTKTGKWDTVAGYKCENWDVSSDHRLRFVGYAKDGSTEESRIEVTKIDKRTLASSQFEYPPTYRTIDLSQMLQGLGGLPGMPGGMPMPGMSGGFPIPGMPPHHNPHPAPPH
jgi:uncharacterized protein DUF4412